MLPLTTSIPCSINPLIPSISPPKAIVLRHSPTSLLFFKIMALRLMRDSTPLSEENFLGGNQTIGKLDFVKEEDRRGLWSALVQKIHCWLGILFERCAMFSDQIYQSKLPTQEMKTSRRRTKRRC